MELDRLNEMHIDVLREIGNIGSGNAATALASILSNTVSIDVPKVNIVDVNEAICELGLSLIHICFKCNGHFQHAMVVAIKAAAPVLIISMAVGLIISIFQAATQIHEQTLTFVPKLIAIAVVLIILAPWLMESMSDFVRYIFEIIATMG